MAYSKDHKPQTSGVYLEIRLAVHTQNNVTHYSNRMKGKRVNCHFNRCLKSVSQSSTSFPDKNLQQNKY